MLAYKFSTSATLCDDVPYRTASRRTAPHRKFATQHMRYEWTFSGITCEGVTHCTLGRVSTWIGDAVFWWANHLDMYN